MKRLCIFIAVCCLALVTSACTPSIYPMGPMVQKAEMLDDAFVMADGAVLPMKTWQSNGAPAAIIVALHGMNDYSNAFSGPAAFWAKQNITTYAYDQRGFGEAPNRGLWAGVDTMVADAVTISQILKKKHPDVPLIMVGESMGGAVVLNAMNHAELAANRIVLSAPAVWGRQVMPWYQRWPLWIAAHTIPTVELRPRLKIHPSDNIEMLRALGRDPLIIKETRIEAVWGLTNLMDGAYAAVPDIRHDSLILYGKKEDLIPKKAWNGMISRLPQVAPKSWRLVVYDNGYHMLMRDLQADVVLGDIVSYVADKDSVLPSGHEVVEE